MKLRFKILVAVVVCITAVFLAKNTLIKLAVEIGAAKVLGTAVHIDSMAVSFSKQDVHIQGLTVQNPAGFGGGAMVDVPDIEVSCDVAQALKGDLHIRLLNLNLKELNVVKNQDGKLNVDMLKVAQKPQQPSETAQQSKAKNVALQIDTLTLTLGKVTMKDLSQTPPLDKNYDLKISNRTYHNINSGQQLAALVLVEALKTANIKDAAIYGAASVLRVPVGLVSDISNTLLKNVNLNFLHH